MDALKEVSVVKKEDLASFEGRDKIVGRPICLNKQTLEIKKGKDYAEVVFFGDVHRGYPTCLLEKAKEMLDYCLCKQIYVMLMGDLMEAGLKSSIGSSIYEQILHPQEQYESIVEMLEPLARKGLLLGSLRGNHEDRIFKDTGINIMKVICRDLKIPYLGDAAWQVWYVGKRAYKVYTLHGTSGARFNYTKVKALEDVARNVAPAAHIVAMGHVHETLTWAEQFQDISLKRKKVVQPKRFLVLTGHYLGYDKSYAQKKGFGLGKTGSPKIKLYVDRHDIHGSE